jgi:hypothetical protein
MNKGHGTWRFIHVGAAGQLIGGLKPPAEFTITSNQLLESFIFPQR